MKSFNIITLVIFGLFAAIGIAIFAMGGLTGSSSEKIGQVEMWGTLSEKSVSRWIEGAGMQDLAKSINYVQKNEKKYERDLLEAFASGNSPDLILLSHDKIVGFKDKIYPISYENFKKRKFKDEFISEGELYLNEAGIYGLPLVVDPLVMYWNRNLFASNGVSQPPEFWKELFSLSEKLTIKNKSSDILQSAVALGEYSNIEHAKEIISAMLFQTGNKIVDYSRGSLKSSFSKKPKDVKTKPAVSALRYYTEFSNPAKSTYSWNISLNNAKEAFTKGELAIYFGFASEISSISKSNPNLNFDVAPILKRGRNSRETFGKVFALSIPKGTENYSGAVMAANILSNKKSVKALSSALKIPPARRDLLGNSPDEEYLSVFYLSALNSKGWYDPAPKETEKIFKSMINDVTSGRLKISSAVNVADREISNLLKN